MPYAVAADLQARVGTDTAVQLTTDSGTTVDTDKLDDAIDLASGEFDSMISRRYDTPLDVDGDQLDLADFVRQCVLVLADYHLRMLRPPVPDHAIEARKAVNKILEEIRDGDRNLASANAIDSTTHEPPAGVMGYNERQASRSNMAGL